MLKEWYADLENRGAGVEKEGPVRHGECEDGQFNQSVLKMLECMFLLVSGIAPSGFQILSQPTVQGFNHLTEKLMKRRYKLNAPMKERSYVISCGNLASEMAGVDSLEM